MPVHGLLCAGLSIERTKHTWSETTTTKTYKPRSFIQIYIYDGV